MRLAVFSDIHGNLPALEAFTADTEGQVDGYVCLGDIVGYGPHNDECLEMVYRLPNAVLLRGNHEDIFTFGDVGQCSRLAQEFYVRSIANFSRVDLLPEKEEVTIGPWTFRHAIRRASAWLYLYEDSQIPADLERDYFVGHTHHQGVLHGNGRKVINCGSVGQNRKNFTRVSYATADTETGTWDLHQTPYDRSAFVEELRRHSYPEELIAYYNS